MQLNFRGLVMRGALGALAVGFGALGAGAFAAPSTHASHSQHATEVENEHGVENETEHQNSTETVHHQVGKQRLKGTATLRWDPATQMATISLPMTGLTGSPTAELDRGSCRHVGTMLASLTGTASGMFTGQFKSLTGIPSHGWLIALKGADGTMLACGDVHSVHPEVEHEFEHGHMLTTTPTMMQTAKAKLTAPSHHGSHGH